MCVALSALCAPVAHPPARAPFPALLFTPAGKRRYNIKLWKTFTDCFNCLPIAAIIDEKIFTMHGGLSPDLQSMEQIRRVMRPTDVPEMGTSRSIHLTYLSTSLPLLISLILTLTLVVYRLHSDSCPLTIPLTLPTHRQPFTLALTLILIIFDRAPVRPAVVRPGQGHHRLVGERPWRVLHLWP